MSHTGGGAFHRHSRAYRRKNISAGARRDAGGKNFSAGAKRHADGKNFSAGAKRHAGGKFFSAGAKRHADGRDFSAGADLRVVLKMGSWYKDTDGVWKRKTPEQMEKESASGTGNNSGNVPDDKAVDAANSAASDADGTEKNSAENGSAERDSAEEDYAENGSADAGDSPAVKTDDLKAVRPEDVEAVLTGDAESVESENHRDDLKAEADGSEESGSGYADDSDVFSDPDLLKYLEDDDDSSDSDMEEDIRQARSRYRDGGYDGEDDFDEDDGLSDDPDRDDFERIRKGRRKKRRNGIIAAFVIIAAVIVALIIVLGSVLSKHYESFDPFDGISLSYDGISGEASAAVAYRDASGGTTVYASKSSVNDAQKNLIYIPDKTENLSDGDRVTVTLSYTGAGGEGGDDSTAHPSDDEITAYCQDNFGLTPTEFEKTFTVSGLDADSYISSAADISDASLTRLQSVLSGKLSDDTASWRDASVDGTSYLGAYLLTNKNSGSDVRVNNRLYLVDRVDVKFSNNDTFSYYYYGEFDNVKTDTDGTVTSGGDSVKTTNDSAIQNGLNMSVTYKGYSSLDALYNGTIKDLENDYTVENTVKDDPKKAAISTPTPTPTPTATPTPTPTATPTPTPTATPTPAPTATPTPTPATAVSSAQGYFGKSSTTNGQVFPDSSSRVLSDAEVNSISKETAQDAINEIYARHGAIFEKYPELNTYYSQFSWYKGTTPVSQLNAQNFGETEKANVDKLSARVRS